MDPGHLKGRTATASCSGAAGSTRSRRSPSARRRGAASEVLRRCEVFGRGGGFVFNTIHNVQARTPMDNIVAMIDAVHEHNGD